MTWTSCTLLTLLEMILMATIQLFMYQSVLKFLRQLGAQSFSFNNMKEYQGYEIN